MYPAVLALNLCGASIFRAENGRIEHIRRSGAGGALIACLRYGWYCVLWKVDFARKPGAFEHLRFHTAGDETPPGVGYRRCIKSTREVGAQALRISL